MALLKIGNQFKLNDSESISIHDSLPRGFYTVKKDKSGEFFLEITQNFSLPDKLYGSILDDCMRVINTYKHKQDRMGVLLVGEKGSGKTLLAKLIAHKLNTGLGWNMPVVIVGEPFKGNDFNNFIANLGAKAVIIFDEFEKIYPPKDQDGILSLFDGTYTNEHLFILTVNEHSFVSPYLLNRTGRMHYLLDYNGLNEDFIRQYCDDHLENKEHVDSIANYAKSFEPFSFDMLQAAVFEMNLYKEDFKTVIQKLNIQPEFNKPITSICTIVLPNGELHIVDDDHEQDSMERFSYVFTSSEQSEVNDKSDMAEEEVEELFESFKDSYASFIRFNNEEFSDYDKTNKTFVFIKKSHVGELKLLVKIKEGTNLSRSILAKML